MLRRGHQHLPSHDEGRGAQMAETYNGRKRIRKQFGSIGEVAEMPNLIEVQKSSYEDFLMVKEPAGGRIRGCRPFSSRCSRSPISRGGRRSSSCATSSSHPSMTSTSASSAT